MVCETLIWSSYRFDLILNFDLEKWHWPWNVTTEKERLSYIHLHAKYQVAIYNSWRVRANFKYMTLKDYLDPDMWKCSGVWDTHAFKLKCICSNWYQSVSIFRMTDFNLSNWLLTFKDDLDLNIIPLKMYSVISYSNISNIKLLSAIV